MTKTRFAPWLVFACIGTLVGCTSGDQGSAGNTELNVVIPSGSSQSGPGAPSSFDIEVVEYTINCTGADFDPTTDPNIDSGDTLDQDVQLSGALEVLDTASGGVPTPDFGDPLTEVYVWQGFMDIPADHACTVQLRARDRGGEVICTATEGFNVGADDVPTVKVNVLMMCDISYQAPVGMLDLDGDFSFNIGNYCPDLFVLNCIDPDLEELLTISGVGSFVYSGCQVRFRDADSTCGDNCDPQTCETTPEGLTCTAAPNPMICSADSANGDAGMPCTGQFMCNGLAANAGDLCTQESDCTPIAGTSPPVMCDSVQCELPGTCVPRGPQTTVTCESDAPGFFCAIPNAVVPGLFRTPCLPVAGDTCFDLSGGLACVPGSVMNCGGAASPTIDPFCEYTGDTLGVNGEAPGFPISTGNGGFIAGCTMVDDDLNPGTALVALTPGAKVTCTADTTDGDEDCDKQKTVDVFCPGDTPCQAFGGDPACQAASSSVCQVGTCNDTGCQGTAATCCSYVDADDGGDCSTECAAGESCEVPPGQCLDGVCTSSNCSDPTAPACDDSNECTTDSCGGDGACDFDPNPGADCNVGDISIPGVDGICQADNTCLSKCDSSLIDCTTANPCDNEGCSAATGTAICDNSPNNSNTCNTCTSGTCVCSGGSCIDGTPACTPPAPVDAEQIPMACRNSFNDAVSTFPIDFLNVSTQSGFCDQTTTTTCTEDGDCPTDETCLNGCIEAGQPFSTALDVQISLDRAFLSAAATTLCRVGNLLTEAVVNLAQVSVDAVAGATCTEQITSTAGDVVFFTPECDGACGNSTTNCVVVDPVVLALPSVTVPCSAAGAADSEVQFCSTGTVPLAIALTDPPVQTFVDVTAGVASVVFQCNTSSTTNPLPGPENEIGCITANPTPSTPNGLSCAADVGVGNVGEEPFPTSECNTTDGPPTLDQTCLLGGPDGTPLPCSGTCDTVPVGVDPSTVCATFTVE